MSYEEHLARTKHGQLRYTLSICDECGIKVFQPDTWFSISEMLNRFRYSLKPDSKNQIEFRFNEILASGFCSFKCLKKGLVIALGKIEGMIK